MKPIFMIKKLTSYEPIYSRAPLKLCLAIGGGFMLLYIRLESKLKVKNTLTHFKSVVSN